jgi:branched-chain amino acid transport system permease protein
MRTFLLLPLLLVVPLVTSAYQVYVLDTIVIAFVGALGLNLLTGYAGQVSTGHGAFVGVGAFTSALLVTRVGAPIWLSIPAAGCVTALVGLLVGLPSVRIRGLYLAVSTLAAQMLIGWALSRPFLAGSGSIAAPRPDLLHDDHAYYVLLLGVAIAAALFLHNLSRTRLGRAMLAVRDRELAASAIGIDVARTKLAAFSVCAFYAGIAGALLAHLGQSVNFEQFQLDLSIQYLAMIVIGGLATVRGSLMGAAFITLLPILLRVIMQPLESLLPDTVSGLASSLQLVLFGLVIVASMLLQPRGLASLPLRAWVRRGPAVRAACVQDRAPVAG